MSNIFCNAFFFPDAVRQICNYLTFKDMLPLSQASQKLYHLTGNSNVWKDLCAMAEIREVKLTEIESQRFKFFAQVEACNPLSLLAFGRFFSNGIHVKRKIELARTFFEAAIDSKNRLDTGHDEEFISYARLEIEKMDCLYGSSDNEFANDAHDIYIKNMTLVCFRGDFKVLKVIRNFRKEFRYDLWRPRNANFDSFYISPNCKVSPEVRMEADSYRCYQWAFDNHLGTHPFVGVEGHKLYDRLTKNKQITPTIKDRLELIKAIRQTSSRDRGLQEQEKAYIYKNASVNENLPLEERSLAKFLLARMRVLDLIDDEVATIDDCIKIFYELQSMFKPNLFNSLVKSPSVLEFGLLPILQMYSIVGKEIPNKILEDVISQILDLKNVYFAGFSAVQYAKFCLTILYDQGAISNLGILWARINLTKAISYIQDFMFHPQPPLLPSMDIANYFHVAQQMLNRFTELKKTRFEQLDLASQCNILKLNLQDEEEINQLIDLTLAENYFQNETSNLSYGECVDILKKIMQNPVDYDELSRARWEDRYVRAMKLLEKEVQNDSNWGNCVLQ